MIAKLLERLSNQNQVYQPSPFLPPQPGSVWEHHSGRHYRVFCILNEKCDKPNFRPMVAYCDVETGTPYCRFLEDWYRSMLEVPGDTISTEQEEADRNDPAYWRGFDYGTVRAAHRWEEALNAPIPRPGIMNEPLESLYRATEALRIRTGDKVGFASAKKN